MDDGELRRPTWLLTSARSATPPRGTAWSTPSRSGRITDAPPDSSTISERDTGIEPTSALRSFGAIGEFIGESRGFYVASSRGVPSRSHLWSEVAAQGGHIGEAGVAGELPAGFKHEIGEPDGLCGDDGVEVIEGRSVLYEGGRGQFREVLGRRKGGVHRRGRCDRLDRADDVGLFRSLTPPLRQIPRTAFIMCPSPHARTSVG